MKQLILASQSPRRKQLLSHAGLDFLVKSVPTDECFPKKLPINKVSEFIAFEKANALWKTLTEAEKNNTLVIAADTIVALDNQILGKPENKQIAIKYLKMLSDRVHKVLTGVCLMDNNKTKKFTVQTRVSFRKLTETQIQYYLKHYQPYDKAGAYAIQEWIGMIGIDKIIGDYYNVVGLPMGELLLHLKKFCPELEDKI